MTPSTFLALLPALLGLAGSASLPGKLPAMAVLAQSEGVIRVPVGPKAVPPALEWVERKGPRCLHSDSIESATLPDREHVDFVLFDRRRYRAELAVDCPALDFYRGFYLTPEDAQICAGRDAIRSRIGGSCRIERFKRLVPRPAR